MKIKVNVEGWNFEVEIIDPLARPVVAYVEGERFEIWPEEESSHSGYGRAFLERGSASSIRVNGDSAALPGKRENGGVDSNGDGNRKKNENSNGPQPDGYANQYGNRRNRLNKIHAPIPGIIRSVDVSTGDAVQPGQPLCVLEAMKMYNTIRATRSGVVSAVHVEPGTHVGRFEVLVEVGDR